MSKLILIRHGQSIWNLQNRFTGWIDISLSKKGVKEARNAGKILSKKKFDYAFTSTLARAQQTLFEIIEASEKHFSFTKIHEYNSKWYSNFEETKNDKGNIKVFIAEELNERYYGDLQGLNKEDTAKRYGDEQVHIWRRSYDIAPPNGESLKMTSERTIPYFKKKIIPLLKKDKNIIIAAHGNSLRSIIKYLEKLSPKKILDVEIPTGTPIEYKLDDKAKFISKRILKFKK